uniref:Uncharacterized protein n=1 Tax=Tetradesmus obliquus TaxID=3088 RepID=A0A383VTF7_TETOB|eukprot:jgi/Sobl393_1/13208/SZX68785.1
MDRGAKPEDTLHTVAKLFNVQPVFYNTPTIVREQVPGAMLMDPYKAPKADEEIIGYELYYPRMCQRAVFGKKGTDITKLVPHSSMLYIEGVNEKKA